MGRIWESINASNQHMLTHVPNGQIAGSPLWKEKGMSQSCQRDFGQCDKGNSQNQIRSSCLPENLKVCSVSVTVLSTILQVDVHLPSVKLSRNTTLGAKSRMIWITTQRMIALKPCHYCKIVRTLCKTKEEKKSIIVKFVPQPIMSANRNSHNHPLKLKRRWICPAEIISTAKWRAKEA